MAVCLGKRILKTKKLGENKNKKTKQRETKKKKEKRGKQVQSLTKVKLGLLMGTNLKGLHPIGLSFSADNRLTFHPKGNI